MHVKNIENIKLYTVDTKRYSDDNFKENILELGQVQTFEYPSMLYLVLLADSVPEAPGDFELTYTFVNSTERDRHAVVDALGLEMETR